MRSLTENPKLAGGADSPLGSGWTAETELCNGPASQETFWTGIGCVDPIRRPGVVSRIDLPQGPFFGNLPPSWGDLLEPTFIDLNYNWFTGPLPENWSKLTKLKTLRLEWNRQAYQEPTAKGLRGPIPESWSAMTSLETLLLSGNGLTGTFPAAAFNSMEKLTRFNIDGNTRLSGFLPKTWGERGIQMSYADDFDQSLASPKTKGPDLYGINTGAKLFTKSGPLWRTQITNWEGLPDNSADNTSPLPAVDPCVKNPLDQPVCIE